MERTKVVMFRNEYDGNDYEVNGRLVTFTFKVCGEWMTDCAGIHHESDSFADATEKAGDFLESRYGDCEFIYDESRDYVNPNELFEAFGIEGVANMLGVDECEVESIAYDLGYL